MLEQEKQKLQEEPDQQQQGRPDNPEEQERPDHRISRRRMLTSLGMTGLALVAGSSMLRTVSGVSAMPVTENVYSPLDKPSISAKGTSPVLNVRDFGAVGDGITDDTPAIQNALNQALHNSYTHIVVPKGTYKVTDTLRIYRRTRFSMQQGATLLRCHDYSFMANGKLNDSFQGYEGHGDIIIEGGSLGREYFAVPG
ncbi:glycosyl hydrolase family 28-related protein [Paenibacillus sp. 32O-W]|uniref:glycosyl hydrolase family 28-related protein n=1 Tax=Paenibacillus sp. 32O-W TaxID=1695218 RepID=UPI00119CA846|nr:glycosyl hydrolase family 28-related protein [Paenibacillus sp. 32O-W]